MDADSGIQMKVILHTRVSLHPFQDGLVRAIFLAALGLPPAVFAKCVQTIHQGKVAHGRAKGFGKKPNDIGQAARRIGPKLCHFGHGVAGLRATHTHIEEASPRRRLKSNNK